MPGAGFKKTARKWRLLQEEVRNKPYNMVVEQQVSFQNVFQYVLELFCPPIVKRHCESLLCRLLS